MYFIHLHRKAYPRHASSLEAEAAQELLAKNKENDSSEGGSSRYQCYACGEDFDNPGDLQRHQLTQHMQKGEEPK